MLIFAFPIPGYARGVVNGILTQVNVKKAYAAVGGEDGMKETFAAFVRIGKAEEESGGGPAGGGR